MHYFLCESRVYMYGSMSALWVVVHAWYSASRVQALACRVLQGTLPIGQFRHPIQL